MKNVIGKYAFEVVVIFIGITASFLFEEWRQNQEKEEKAIEIMESMVIELERNDNYARYADTIYFELDSAIQLIIQGNNGNETDGAEEMLLADVTFGLMEEITKNRLINISSFIRGFSSSDQLHLINSNKEIITYLSYLETVLVEHENYTNDIRAYASLNLWPAIYDYGLANYLVCKSESEFNNYQQSASNLIAKDIKELKSDHGLIKHLKWSQLKLRRLIEINQFIHKHIKNTIRELNKAIEEA
ncbi:hypothetical protein [Reichenbachiella sp.]|uniref:hypothetical protein n=1 Tax=Reichenbachiella sp. TaxID=2184521 RepID=UPI003BB0DE3D